MEEEFVTHRLMKFAEYKGLNRISFERSIGKSSSYLKNSKDVTSSVLKKLMKVYPDLNINWLITGEGYMIKSGDSNINQSVDNISSGRDSIKNNNGIVGNNNNQSVVFGNTINISVPEKGNFKIINEKGIEISYEELPQTIESQRTIEGLKQAISQLEVIIRSNDQIIKSKDSEIYTLKRNVEDLRSMLELYKSRG